jgi:uncharacterized damage-inducible protein DinB
MLSTRPDASEYASYYDRYLAAVPDTGDFLASLEAQGASTVALLRSLSEAQAEHRYAPDKWSVKEMVGHVIDAERVFSYRALHVARGDKAPLPSFEQEDWVRVSNAGSRPIADLANEFAAVRASTLALFRSLDDAALVRRGIANKIEVTPRALAWIIAGHERHHRGVLTDRYLTRKEV